MNSRGEKTIIVDQLKHIVEKGIVKSVGEPNRPVINYIDNYRKLVSPVVNYLLEKNFFKISDIVFDLGGGTGASLSLISQYVHCVITCDVSIDHIRAMYQTFKLFNIKNIISFHGTLSSFPVNTFKVSFPKNVFDSSICLGSLREPEDVKIFLKTSKDIVKIGGKICLSVPLEYWNVFKNELTEQEKISRKIFKRRIHPYYFPEEVLSGYKILDVYKYNRVYPANDFFPPYAYEELKTSLTDDEITFLKTNGHIFSYKLFILENLSK